VLFGIAPAIAFIAVAVALSLRARAGGIEAEGPNTTPTPTPTATPPAKFRVLPTVPLHSNACGSVTVNSALNKIYTSGNPSNNFDIRVTVIDGVTFVITDVELGQGVSVDNKTNRYWAATLYQGSVVVRDGDTNGFVATVPIPAGCPIQTNYDFNYNRVWTSTQCGACNDPIFAVDASHPFSIVSPQINSGGVMAGIIANSANGRLYFAASLPNCNLSTYISKRVNPTTFAVTNNAFGRVLAINAGTNMLYAVPDGTNNLQIINGAPDPEVILKTITLPYNHGAIGINTAQNYLYIANPAGNSLEVRDPSTGALITIFAHLPATPDGSIAVDSIRGRIYIISFTPSPQLIVIEDLINAFKPGAIISHF
jgi:hypothetical protein